MTVCHRVTTTETVEEQVTKYTLDQPPVSSSVPPPGAQTELSQTDKSVILRTASELTAAKPDAYCVPWIGSYEFARKLSAAAAEAHAVYFCSEKIHALAGEGPEAWNAYKRTHSGASPDQTLFEFPSALAALNSAGIRLLCKVADTSSNADLFRAHGATAGMLYIFAPNGEKLAAFNTVECTGEALPTFLTTQFKQKLAAAKQRK